MQITLLAPLVKEDQTSFLQHRKGTCVEWTKLLECITEGSVGFAFIRVTSSVFRCSHIKPPIENRVRQRPHVSSLWWTVQALASRLVPTSSCIGFWKIKKSITCCYWNVYWQCTFTGICLSLLVSCEHGVPRVLLALLLSDTFTHVDTRLALLSLTWPEIILNCHRKHNFLRKNEVKQFHGRTYNSLTNTNTHIMYKI